MIRVNGVGGMLLKAVQSFYKDSMACVRVGNDDVSDWFPVNVGLRRGCMMAPWSFNIYMDGVVREVNVMVLGIGLELLIVPNINQSLYFCNSVVSLQTSVLKHIIVFIVCCLLFAHVHVNTLTQCC